MYCQNCGQEVNDNAVVCVHCGCPLKSNGSIANSENKTVSTTGLLLGLFLGLIGLIIGIVIYKDDETKQLFIKSWGKGFIISIVAGIILSILGTCSSLFLGEFLYDLF